MNSFLRGVLKGSNSSLLINYERESVLLVSETEMNARVCNRWRIAREIVRHASKRGFDVERSFNRLKSPLDL